MKEYKYLLFDADNTLFDFNRCENAAFKLALEGSTLAYTDEVYEAYHKINDDLWKVLEKGGIDRPSLKVERYRQLFERFGAEGDGYKEVSKRYEKLLGLQTYELDGTYEMLVKLQGRYPVYVITNGLTSVQESRFSLSRIAKLVKKVYISEAVGIAKPNKGYFEYVINDVGDTDKSKYLVIGDSLSSDIDGAINTGLDCIWFNRDGADKNGREPTYIADSTGAILKVLGVE